MQFLRSFAKRFRGELTAIAIFLSSRALVFLAFWAAAFVAKIPLIGALHRWDATWYGRLVLEGYPRSADGANGIAFFPVYPLIVDAFRRLTWMDVPWSGVVVNLGLGCCLAVVFWRFALRLTNRPVATRATALFFFFPGSFVLSMAYSETVMLIAATACLLFLLNSQWLLAGIAAAIGTASRPNALALVVACGVGAGVAIYRNREWRALVAPALAPVGFVGFMAFVWHRTGEPFGWWHVQRDGWQERFDFGWGMLRRARAFLSDPFSSPNETIALLGVLGFAVIFYLLVRWRPPWSVIAYTATIIALAVGSATIGGRPRFILVAFPLFVALARVIRRTAYPTTTAVFAGALCLLVVITATTTAITP